ncbi:glycosyltransferase [Sinomonas notoginsengisoli]|uniref:glycosyltransferase n=1 Tax=Sinomonas notoginsengisoli TaxID=1457311 RepID=UPI001F2B48C0|nr:glycosyltransferase [Sinomonas notoginsengisoli]
MDTVPLYVDMGAAAGVRIPKTGFTASDDQKPRTVSSPTPEAHSEDFVSRFSMAARPGDRVSFGTYFNAFPASYWRRWTTVDSVRLSVTTSGTGAIVVYKSNSRGSLQRVDSASVEGQTTTVFDLSLKPFGDGGWYWFDVVAGSGPVVVRGAEWQTSGPAPRRGTVTLQITTLNKTDFCLNNLRLLAQDAEALDVLQEILIVDQGSDKVARAEGFDDVRARLGGRLRVIEQRNLGGSGGFSRGMYEAVANGSDYVLLMDDDIVVETESILRLVTFADRCKTPTLVGGHMFDLYNRTVLHTFGEVVNPYRIQPALPSEDAELGHDFMVSNLRQTPWLHRRADVDYNGWWMCLIPTSVIREIGLSLPIFIKWDDAEYGLRAKERGFPTVSMPGAGVWHVSWVDKDDLVGWQAYFHTRNRAITALLHSPYELGGRVIRELQQDDVKHLMSMQYATVQGRSWALRDLLKGPKHLPGILETKLPEIRKMLSTYTDSMLKPDPDDFPPPRMAKPPRHGQGFRRPNSAMLVPWALKTVVRQLAKPVVEQSKERPQANVPHIDNKWWRMSQYDSAIVSNAEGTGASWYRRDPRTLRRMLAESAKLHADLLTRWRSLSSEYKNALHDLTSIESWRETFNEHTLSDSR